MSHPNEQDLALFATNDLTFFSRFLVTRHLHRCPACAETVEAYREVSVLLAESEPQIPDWENLALEMRANIRVGLEAGACLDAPPRQRSAEPRP